MSVSENEPGHVRMMKSIAKDYSTIFSAIERGQASGAYSLVEARAIADACGELETFINDAINRPTVSIHADGVSGRWDTLVIAMEKACRKGSFGLNEAATIHGAAVRVSTGLKTAISYYERQAESTKNPPKVRFLPAPEDNIASPPITQ